VLVYHRTFAADEILATGFRDAEGTFMTPGVHSGVWVSDRPLDENDGATGGRLLVVDVPETAIIDCEWIEAEKRIGNGWCQPTCSIATP
jgi:hypothetical protein